MGRLTLNVLLSFAQFEREVTSERIRDKIGASKRRGLAGHHLDAPRESPGTRCQPVPYMREALVVGVRDLERGGG